jgi:hypothetical protein
MFLLLNLKLFIVETSKLLDVLCSLLFDLVLLFLNEAIFVVTFRLLFVDLLSEV